MLSRSLPLMAVLLAVLASNAQAITYRSDGSLSLSQGLADQPQFSGTGIVALANESGTGEIIAPNWVLTAKHVVTGDYSSTPAANAVTFYFAGGNRTSDAIYSDPNSDITLVHFAVALPSNLAIIVPNPSDTTANPTGQQIWNVGYGSYGPYGGSLTGNSGARLAGTNIVNGIGTSTINTFTEKALAFTNENTAGTEFESSTAPGDSGGPMFLQNGYQWVVAGEVFGVGSVTINGTTSNQFIDTDVNTDNFITATTGLTFTARAAPTAISWTSTYTGNSNSGNTIALKTPTDGGGTWDVSRLDFTDGTYTYAWQNGTLLPVTFGVGNGAAGTVTLGSPINISNLTFAATGSGSYTIAGSGSNVLTLSTSGSAITVNAGVTPTISAPMTGTGAALTKLGPGTLTLSGANTYDGGTTVSAGAIALTGTGTLGSTSGALSVANGATVDLGGTNQGVGALNGAGLVTNTAGTASTLTVGNGSPTVGGAFSGAIRDGTSSAIALIKTGAGSQTINSTANTFSGGTTLNGGTLTITNASGLGTGGVIYSGTAMLNLGGTNYVAPTLALTAAANTGFTGGASNGNLTVTGASGLNLIGTNTGATTEALNLAALTSFTYNQNQQNFNVYSTATGTGSSLAPTNVTQVTLANSNAITAAQVNLGANGSNVAVFPLSQLDLGTNNAINTGAIVVGGYRGNALLDFASGLSNPSVTLRDINGLGAVTSLTVGQNSSGGGSSFGTVDLSAGRVDAAIVTLTVGYESTGNTQTAQGAFTMGTGTMNLGSLVIADNTDANTGAVFSNGTFTQNGGSVIANTVTLGSNRATAGTPTLTGVYNLGTATSAANLSAAAINLVANRATNAASRATLNWNNGTISTYDSSSNGGNVAGGPATQSLTISGLSGGGAGGNSTTLTLNLVDGPGVTHTFSAANGQSITVASTALITGSGALTKAGPGMLTLAGANSYTGATNVTAGTLLVNGAQSGTGLVTVSGSGTMLGGTGSLAAPVSVTTGTLDAGTNAAAAGSAASVGRLTVGALTLSNTATAVFDLSSSLLYDQVVANGNAALGGTLTLNVLSGGTFPAGQTLDLIHSTGTLSGTFAGFANMGVYTYGNNSFEALYTPTDFDLVVTAAAVPEPGTFVWLGGALLAFAVGARCRWRQRGW